MRICFGDYATSYFIEMQFQLIGHGNLQNEKSLRMNETVVMTVLVRSDATNEARP